MPYVNVPTGLTQKMDDCVASVMAEQGLDKERAIAICYTSVVEHQHEALAVRWAEAPQAPDGRAWEVTIIGADTPADFIQHAGRDYIRSKNGRLYTVEGIKGSLSQWDGVKVFDNHLTDAEFKERVGMRSFLTEGVGVLTNPRWDEEAHCLKATLKIVDDAARSKLLNAFTEGVLQHIGLSVDTLTEEGKAVTIAGQRYPVMKKFDQIFSLDIVSEPAAGGRFNRVIAAVATTVEVKKMEFTKDEFEALRAMVAAQSATSEQLDEELDPADAAEVVADAVETAVTEAPAATDPATLAQDMADAAQAAADEVADEQMAIEEEQTTESMQARVRKLECRLLLNERLDAAKLPPAERRIVEAAFAGRVFEEVELSRVIKRAKEAQASHDASGRVSNASRGLNVLSVMSPRDQAAAGFMDLLGQRRFGGLRGLEHNEADYVQERIPAWYKSWINAGRPNYRPRKLSNWLYEFVDNPLSMRATEANDVSAVTQDAVNVFLAAAYSKKHEWWTPIVTDMQVDTIDDVHLVTDYGLSNLDIVAKGAVYTALDLRDDEQTGTFVKHGNYLAVPIEDMLLDRLNVFEMIPQKLANAWYNTLSAKVAAVFTTNSGAGPVLTDTGALFNATATSTAGGHANLLTTALSFTTLDASEIAMMSQTDQKLGAGQKQLITAGSMLVPVNLRTAALRIRNSEMLPGSANNDVNPHYQGFEVVTVPEWTDTNNWALVANKNEYPAIYLIYVNGFRVPQVITAGDKASGAMFTNDTMRWKVQLFTYQFSSTYNCAPVADFRPLHKSNVT